ncbi:hypothetical protein [Oleisolibacter albus]|uniref:hypothetical protein n=1 Tax=Oleisolibacter albus TaxID=2171757 RepID=UPI0012D72923|nr:hypothetical protein [Oleisolibacter albus]
MLHRRQLLAGLMAAPLLLSGQALAEEGHGEAPPKPAKPKPPKPVRPPDNFMRLSPIVLPVPERGPYAYARIEADLVLKDPLQRDAAKLQQPAILSRIVDEAWASPVSRNGRIDSDGAKAIKERILRAARQVLGPDTVQEVLIASLLVMS